MFMFVLKSSFVPTGDQPTAIAQIKENIKNGVKNQVLLGVTGSGKTFTIANVIRDLNMPALVISHNKTLAGQVYQEMRDFFPTNAVSYFVSYYDYYQPEAYIPATDTYIEKEAQINEHIDKLRLQSTTNILTHKDVIVVASVSCIYNIGSPLEYGKFVVEIELGHKASLGELGMKLVKIQYERSEFEFKRGTFRLRGNSIDIYPAYDDTGWRVTIENGKVAGMVQFDPLSGQIVANAQGVKSIIIYPAKHFMTDPNMFEKAEKEIRTDLTFEHGMLLKAGKKAEADRLLRRVNYDLEMIKEVGYVNGIENYSRYFDGRKKGEEPYSLLTYFKKVYGDKFLVFIDESHMTVPQIRGMYNGDYSRKNMLIYFGFRLRAALDNRPMKFDEFYKIPPHIIYTSATPDSWELEKSNKKIVEQLIRPTGIVDPKIMIRPAISEVMDLTAEIETRAKTGQKILVTTLTKKVAEDLSSFLKERNIRAEYLHSDIQTLERSDILDKLRKNEFDVLIGVNLLREGLDLPEVFLVAILDADKEGFLRSRTSLIQTMGRAARNIQGEVILYADTITKSMKAAIEEIDRRRAYQEAYNRKHHITAVSIHKPIREKIIDVSEMVAVEHGKKNYIGLIDEIKSESMTPYDRKRIIKKLEVEMRRLADNMQFEAAIAVREKIKELKVK
ncbi:excinuclease ABC subunit B [Candidatus Roizmanbacteria bacterium CG_4_10_14_0_8_um_filter_39_9]|uniref:UvrABC system protein B n=1 Tax=Candidatus Roizmanbacteria bacterium CG_4_10_14_0_8_um_filter_39_9 TaxID=1974829 RepID=A0A2M7QDM9_9BACT|nr:MAG: excinuclease ABC subunit B [Candidatus Roizmanbacteria bacterium CG_4_10_14_0_8_um_filter_39_9]